MKHLRREYVKPIAGRWRDLTFWQDIFIRDLLLPILFRRNDGVGVYGQKWDNLVILDACRYDTFAKQAWRLNGTGKLEPRISLASDTKTFLLSNFPKKRYDDIVYVAANPHVSRFMRRKFHTVLPVWASGWDESERTVPPSAVLTAALKAASSYPNKRLIVHFMQPHHPYLGFKPSFHGMRRIEKRPPHVYSTWPEDHGWYNYLLTHKQADLLKLYEMNLSRVLAVVKELIAELGGVTVVTSDHGEAFGERLTPLLPVRVYEHPPNVRIPVLVTVPWYTVVKAKKASTPEVGETRTFDSDEEKLVSERLKALGYE